MTYEGHFNTGNLDKFQIEPKGITFYYPYDFNHASLYCEPPGEFFLSLHDIRPFLRPNGPLAGMTVSAEAN
jgi:hypothetical protein